jgi:hypothetical protein
MKTILAAVCLWSACYGQSVTIVNSGSTNSAGFRIVVEKSGAAEYTQRPRRSALSQGETPKTVRKTVPESLAKTLYDDVSAAHPLASLPAHGCMKSASFGTRLTIRFGEDESPDLSCGDGGNAKLQALIRDANQIVNIFREP